MKVYRRLKEERERKRHKEKKKERQGRKAISRKEQEYMIDD